ncbi:DNA methyltransferase [uncultured Brachyspira sp.]|uniref:DNA methyltransferase n=1 Tax=uncultured Brachyspira sp. TaxID=221953 RepID=UPI00261EBD18|nr:DNA methyltransferase [uncultured Brachyspira sp.]
MNKYDLITINDAAVWASKYTNKVVTISNISYLIQYALIDKVINNGIAYISQSDLKKYYDKNKRELDWKEKLGNDLNWKLSFDDLKESDTTKHVHRIHPYKGKFIPQLVEYFIDSHTDEFKKDVYFKKNDVILDPFCGSGTTLVQANELGINAIGIDISNFNSMISNCKVDEIDLIKLENIICIFTNKLENYVKNNVEFENELNNKLFEFNNIYFNTLDYKKKVRNKEIDPKIYGKEKEDEFLIIYNNLIKKYNIELYNNKNNDSFIYKWFIPSIVNELEYMSNLIKDIDDVKIKDILQVILSRTMRSCRATTHSDLGTLLKPVITTYYCRKHYKICKPLFSITKWWSKYSIDTIKRLYEFNKLRTNTHQLCISGDSRTIDIFSILRDIDNDFYEFVKNKKIKGIFTSPPYIGLIDYHEQHAYAYDLFGFDRNDNYEIGALFKGKSSNAKNEYVKDISQVLINSKKYMINDYDVFIVANDKYNLYPIIAEKSDMKIVNTFKRPVLNRVEKDKSAYSEIIFHLKEL